MKSILPTVLLILFLPNSIQGKNYQNGPLLQPNGLCYDKLRTIKISNSKLTILTYENFTTLNELRTGLHNSLERSQQLYSKIIKETTPDTPLTYNYYRETLNSLEIEGRICVHVP